MGTQQTPLAKTPFITSLLHGRHLPSDPGAKIWKTYFANPSDDKRSLTEKKKKIDILFIEDLLVCSRSQLPQRTQTAYVCQISPASDGKHCWGSS